MIESRVRVESVDELRAAMETTAPGATIEFAPATYSLEPLSARDPGDEEDPGSPQPSSHSAGTERR